MTQHSSHLKGEPCRGHNESTTHCSQPGCPWEPLPTLPSDTFHHFQLSAQPLVLQTLLFQNLANAISHPDASHTGFTPTWNFPPPSST